MHRAERHIDVDVPASHFYALVTDFANYPNFLSTVSSVEIHQAAETAWDVSMSIRVLKRLDYRLHVIGRPHTSVRWTLAEPGPFVQNDGGWRIDALGEHQIRVHYDLSVDVAAFVPRAITNRLISMTFPQMLSEWKAHAEATWQKEPT